MGKDLRHNVQQHSNRQHMDTKTKLVLERSYKQSWASRCVIHRDREDECKETL